MRKLIPAVAAGLLLMGTAAWATDNSPGASGHEKQTGKMQGSPNAAGFKKDDATGSTGTAGTPGMSRSGTSNSTGAHDAGSGSSPGAKGAGSGSR